MATTARRSEARPVRGAESGIVAWEIIGVEKQGNAADWRAATRPGLKTVARE